MLAAAGCALSLLGLNLFIQLRPREGASAHLSRPAPEAMNSRILRGLFPWLPSLVATFVSIATQGRLEKHGSGKQVKAPQLSRQERERLDASVISLLDLLRGAVASGLTIPDALRLATLQRREEDAVGRFLHELHIHTASGLSLSEALHQAAPRAAPPMARLCLDLQLVLKAGSRAVDVLERLRSQVADSAERQRKLAIATAQMRLQGTIVAFAPLFAALALCVFRPDHLLFFCTSANGFFTGVVTVTLWLVGFLWLRLLMKTGETT